MPFPLSQHVFTESLKLLQRNHKVSQKQQIFGMTQKLCPTNWQGIKKNEDWVTVECGLFNHEHGFKKVGLINKPCSIFHTSNKQ